MRRAVRCAAVAAVASISFIAGSDHVRAQPSPNTATQPSPPQSPTAAVHTGPTIAYIYDIASGTTNTAPVPGDEAKLPNVGAAPSNPVLFERPVRPAHPSFPIIVFGDNNFCSGTAIGRRIVLTAGHCVFDKDTNAFRKSANVYSGYPPADPGRTFKARRFVAFNGWTSSRDTAHDVALVELDSDLPADIALFEMSTDAYACEPNGTFDRHYYVEPPRDQLTVQANHIGCRDNLFFWAIGTLNGSSGSGAIKTGTNKIYGVFSNTSTDSSGARLGNDAPLSAGKVCFIGNRYLGQPCQPPENVGPARLTLETPRLQVIQGAAFVDVVVHRLGNPAGAVQVQYDTGSMTAVDGRDFRRTQGTLVWSDGDNTPKTVRIPLIPTSDPECEREFTLSLSNSVSAEILGESYTIIGIISSSLPREDRQLVLKQLVVRMDTEPGLPAISVLYSPDGRSAYSNRGYTFASFWRDPQRGTLRFQRMLQDPAGGFISRPSMSPDGKHVIRLADAEVQVLARQPPSMTLAKINGLGFDYDRYTQFDITQSPDSRADVYVAAHNPTLRRPGILRYQHDPLTGALTDKRVVRAGEGGIPNAETISSLAVTKDGRFLLALGSTPNQLMSFRRAGDGTLQFVQAVMQGFGAYIPVSLVLTPDSNFVHVIGSTTGNQGRIFTFLIGSNGDLTPLPPTDVPYPGQAVVSPDGKALYLTSGAVRPWLYKYAIDGSSLSLTGKYDPQRCTAKPELNFGLGWPVVSPDGRFIMLGATERAIAILQQVD